MFMEMVEIKCRCKNCENSEPTGRKGQLYCYFWDYEQGMSPNIVGEMDFCSHGEPQK